MKMLLDPTKEQLHVPASALQLANSERGEQEVVGQKNQAQIFLSVEVMDASQRIGIQLRGSRSGELDGLIGSHSARTADRTPVAPPELGVVFGACDEERTTLFEHVEPREIQITAVEQIKSPCFGQQLIENADIVHRTAGHINIGRNVAAQIEQRVRFDRAFAARETATNKNRWWWNPARKWSGRTPPRTVRRDTTALPER